VAHIIDSGDPRLLATLPIRVKGTFLKEVNKWVGGTLRKLKNDGSGRAHVVTEPEDSRVNVVGDPAKSGILLWIARMTAEVAGVKEKTYAHPAMERGKNDLIEHALQILVILAFSKSATYIFLHWAVPGQKEV